ncbi:hypothetical protein Tsubulata_037935 [Turnera subulata]|uniref:Sec-independent protein translocase protein TatB n=1 Tax=Turnera subulata TaxID=218843 RepID=A0A9Q0FKI4_9ROSI|nr:hypothetical protein Tsubulata_037935 [Turnera subulata]
MFGISYGEIFLIIGATAALIGPKDLPLVARTAGRLAGRAIGYVQMARGQFESVMQQSQARQVHKELQDTMAQLEAIRHEIRSISILNPGPATRRLVDNLDNTSASNGDIVPENVSSENVPRATASTVSAEQAAYASLPSSKLAQDSGSKASESCTMHTQAMAYARLAALSATKAASLQNGTATGELIEDAGFDVLPVSAESAGMLSNRPNDLKGSDIVLEAILEAEVAHNAKDFFSRPENQVRHES